MRVKVRLMRQQGRNMHQKEHLQQPPFVGELTVSEGKNHELGRQVLRARLLDTSHGTEHDILPELSDVQLLFLEAGKMRLAGFELVNKAAYAQTWSVEAA